MPRAPRTLTEVEDIPRETRPPATASLVYVADRNPLGKCGDPARLLASSLTNNGHLRDQGPRKRTTRAVRGCPSFQGGGGGGSMKECWTQVCPERRRLYIQAVSAMRFNGVHYQQTDRSISRLDRSVCTGACTGTHGGWSRTNRNV